MVGAVGQQSGHIRGAEVRGAGKRAEAVGHQAKASVAAAREAELEVPKNAQGKAASAIARGIDPASLFAARVADAVPDGGEAIGEGEVVALPGGTAPAEAGEPAADMPGTEAGGTGEAVTVLPEPREEVVAEPVPVTGPNLISEDPAVALLLAKTAGGDQPDRP